MNIIGDIAGEYEVFRKLIALMPEGEVVAAGDLNDRGPDSRKVMDWFMEGRGVAIMGNHDLIFLNYARRRMGFHERLQWFSNRNGGRATLENFKNANGEFAVPDEYVAWCLSRPYHVMRDDVIITHAPIKRGFYDDIVSGRVGHGHADFFWEDLVWNRKQPKRADRFQVFGHLGTAHTYTDKKGTFAICVDDSHRDSLVGLHWETKRLYRVPLV